MFIGVMVCAGLLLAAADFFLLCRQKRVGTCLWAIFQGFVVSNLFSLAICKYVLRMPQIFQQAANSTRTSLKFFCLTMAVGLFLLLVKGIAEHRITVEKKAPKHKVAATLLRVFSGLFFAVGAAAFSATIWGGKTFDDLTPDQMVINLNSPLGGTSPEIVNTLFEGPVFFTVVSTILFSMLFFSNHGLVYHKNDQKAISFFPGLAKRIISLLLALAMLAGGVAFGVSKFQLQKLYAAYFDVSPYIEENFADPRTVNLKFPEKKRNLIHIYLESVENTYFSRDLGGNVDQNLMPELAELAKEGYSFSNRPEGFGGPPRTTGGHWSVAAMVNMGTGLPMKVPVDGNAYGSPENFLPGALTLGDILKEQGYVQSVMFGADADFGGLTYYFQSHGDFRIRDYKAAKELGWIPEDYYVWWGFEDSKLFEFAKQELNDLYATGKPFHFVMETANTHFPDGYLEADAPTPYESQYANVIAYSSKQTEAFVRWIQQQPFYADTTIVLIGDHLSMDKTFFTNLPSGYTRTTFNLILNPAPQIDRSQVRTQNRQFASFDMFPTMLAAIGVEIEGNRLGIGANLFSQESTLFERDGVDVVNRKLESRSNFYNENILVHNKHDKHGKKA